jgi:hypothetical protein
MAKAEATVEELVGMIERGELRLPEMQRRYVWRSTRVRDLLDSLLVQRANAGWSSRPAPASGPTSVAARQSAARRTRDGRGWPCGELAFSRRPN